MTELEEPERKSGFQLWMLVPALGALALMAVFLLGLEREDARVLPSPLIDKPVPEFDLPGLLSEDKGLSTADLHQPGVKLVNVWASWCGPCRAEHPQLEEMARNGVVIDSINYKDEPANARGFLNDLGNPFNRIGADRDGRAGIDWGVYGVPETFVIDGQGRIRYKHVGPILPGDFEKKIKPAMDAAAK